MKLVELQKKLIAAARRSPPSAHVPYAFEKRVMARLASVSALDEWSGWIRALWTSAAVCTGIALAIGVWTSLAAPDPESGARFCQDLEQTIWASAEDGEINW